jgi:hypothetical protein
MAEMSLTLFTSTSRRFTGCFLITWYQPCSTECSLNVHWMFTECSLNVHWMFTECSLNVHWMFTERSLNVHWMFTECSLNVHWMFTECSLRPAPPDTGHLDVLEIWFTWRLSHCLTRLSYPMWRRTQVKTNPECFLWPTSAVLTHISPLIRMSYACQNRCREFNWIISIGFHS